MAASICKNLESIHQRINLACERAGRNSDDVTLVAISKTKPDEDIGSALNCRQLHFGENRVRELQGKMDRIHADSVQWHFVGSMQTNKIKYLVDRTDWIQSFYKKKHLKETEKRAAANGRVIHGLIQVNISDEDQKQGCDPSKLEEILRYAQSLEFVRIQGLMGMATYTENPEDVREEFRTLKTVFDNCQHLNSGSVNLKHLSMGMTNDFEVAIEEGSTMVRIGTAIFGERNYDP